MKYSWLTFFLTPLFAHGQINDTFGIKEPPPFNLCTNYRSTYFYVPFNVSNLTSLDLKQTKLDSLSLSVISKAHFISLDTKKCSLDSKDSIYFKEDFNTPYVRQLTDESGPDFISKPVNNFFVIQDCSCDFPRDAFGIKLSLIYALNSGNIYLVSFKLLNQKSDCVIAKDIVLISHAQLYNNRHSTIYGLKKIEVVTSSSDGPSDLSYVTCKFNISVDSNGTITTKQQQPNNSKR